MLCCVIIVAIVSAPVVALRAFLRSSSSDPLAWRLTPSIQSFDTCGRAEHPSCSFFESRARSFVFAGTGVWHVIRSEQSSVIHAAATFAAIGCGLALDISAGDWRWIAIALFVVWSAEAFNTAIESACDILSPEFSEPARIAKDTAAGAVLLVSCGAVVVGLLTFWPYLDPLLGANRALPEFALSICGTAP